MINKVRRVGFVLNCDACLNFIGTISVIKTITMIEIEGREGPPCLITYLQ